MAVRDLSNLVKADDVISTEHLVTLLVVVSKYSQKDWLSHYETLSSFVVCGELKQCQQFHVTCLMHCWLVWSVTKCCLLWTSSKVHEAVPQVITSVSFVALCGCTCYHTVVCSCRSHGLQRNCQRTMSMRCIQWLCFVRWQTHSKHLLVRRVFRLAPSLCCRVKHLYIFLNLGFMTQIWQLILWLLWRLVKSGSRFWVWSWRPDTTKGRTRPFAAWPRNLTEYFATVVLCKLWRGTHVNIGHQPPSRKFFLAWAFMFPCEYKAEREIYVSLGICIEWIVSSNCHMKRLLLRLQVESEINYNAQCIQKKYILGCHIAWTMLACLEKWQVHGNWRGNLPWIFTELQGIVNISSLCRFSAPGCTYVQYVSSQRAFWDMVFLPSFWSVSSVYQQQFLLIAHVPMPLNYSNVLLLCWLQAAVLATSAKNEKKVRTTLESLCDGRNRYAHWLCSMSACW